jgi:hypothetical protein
MMWHVALCVCSTDLTPLGYCHCHCTLHCHSAAVFQCHQCHQLPLLSVACMADHTAALSQFGGA